jgi:hypothetical protein
LFYSVKIIHTLYPFSMYKSRRTLLFRGEYLLNDQGEELACRSTGKGEVKIMLQEQIIITLW